jgi:hypothetical protein
MHDFSLGPPVDVGEYTGPMLNDKPLHKGNCEDGVYGCQRCNYAARELTDEQLTEIGWPTKGHCDWCNKEVPARDITGLKPRDEPSVYYEVCMECRKKYNKELAEIEKELEKDYGDYYGQ